MKAPVFALALVGCALPATPDCNALLNPEYGWGETVLVERTCPEGEFAPSEDAACEAQTSELDAEACEVRSLHYCSGRVVTQARFVGDDGLVTVRQTHEQIATGCRVVVEMRERAR